MCKRFWIHICIFISCVFYQTFVGRALPDKIIPTCMKYFGESWNQVEIVFKMCKYWTVLNGIIIMESSVLPLEQSQCDWWILIRGVEEKEKGKQSYRRSPRFLLFFFWILLLQSASILCLKMNLIENFSF